jgi:hypothetical protein
MDGQLFCESIILCWQFSTPGTLNQEWTRNAKHLFQAKKKHDPQLAFLALFVTVPIDVNRKKYHHLNRP